MGDKDEPETGGNLGGGLPGSEEGLWRGYMDLFTKREERLEAEDKLGLRKPADLPDLPDVESEDEFPARGYPVNIFNQGESARLPNRLRPGEKVDVWKRMGDNPPVDMTCFVPEEVRVASKTESGRWPGVSPCRNPDRRSKWGNRKRQFGEPCAEEEAEDPVPDEPEDDFADHLELWHARVPVTCPSARSNPPMVDRASGLNDSLVSGDYVLTETVSRKKGNRVYANVCLRGLTGMHLPELAGLRARENTWKWCFFQGVIALLAKTQLRYKHTWSGNVDYIYERGWSLFTHLGNMNVKQTGRQKFDDVVVYNYSYNVEVELLQEMRDVPRIGNVRWDFVESNHGRTMKVERKEFTKIESKIGAEKSTDQQTAPVHKATKDIERWFDGLPPQYQNCIFRTTRYSLAFWKEGPFWYLYNPLRCDEFGLWDDAGYACIVKFCSRNALRRHLMVLMLRAYVYAPPKSGVKSGGEAVEEEMVKDVFTVQIFQLIFTRCELVNPKLLQRRRPTPVTRPLGDLGVDTCLHDPLDPVDSCEDTENVENRGWLKSSQVSWTRSESTGKKIVRESLVAEKQRWHQFYVEEPNKLFSLWGEVHPTQGIFPAENRGKQIHACYVVCAGMTRISAPEYWSPKTLDAIVMCGDRYYTISRLEADLRSERGEFPPGENRARYLSGSFKIGETVFEGELLPGIQGRLYTGSYSLWTTLREMFLEHHFGVVTCEGACLGVFKFCGAYYVCDARSTGPPIFRYGAGVVYLIRTTSFTKFMNVLILTIASTECSEFEVNPVRISNAVDVGPTICPAGNELGRKNRCGKPHGKIGRASCPRESSGSQKTKKDACKGQESPCEAAGHARP